MYFERGYGRRKRWGRPVAKRHPHHGGPVQSAYLVSCLTEGECVYLERDAVKTGMQTHRTRRNTPEHYPENYYDLTIFRP